MGKTVAAQQYAQWHDIKHAHQIEKLDEQTRLTIEGAKGVLYTAQITDTPKQLSQHIRDELLRYGMSLLRARGETEWRKLFTGVRKYCPLLIVDEADQLTYKALEQLRLVYDKYGFGLILIGMPGFEKRLARYPQLFSRIGFAHEYKPLSEIEMEFIFEKFWQKLGSKFDKNSFTDVEAVKTIIRITNGNFRLIQRLFDQIRRIQEINNLKNIDANVVLAARDCLVIG